MDYVFVCIGTNQLIEDSFGPRVGDILKKNFDKNTNIKVFGTMKNPIHFQNAPIFLDYLKKEQSPLILIDSALGRIEEVGSTYINLGGVEIGKAFGKSFYFPAHLNIKTIVGTKEHSKLYGINHVNQLAQTLATQIIHSIYEMNIY